MDPTPEKFAVIEGVERPQTRSELRSVLGLCNCLARIGSEGTERPITFASHRFDPTQARWSTVEREAFAIIWSLRKFDQWVFGARVNVDSDHDPLGYRTNSTPHGAKLARWALALQRYDVVASHRKGVNHGNADALWRLPSRCWEE